MQLRPKVGRYFNVGDWVYFQPKPTFYRTTIDTVRGIVVDTAVTPWGSQRVLVDWEDGFVDPLALDELWNSDDLLLV
jgi:hypothetical protein